MIAGDLQRLIWFDAGATDHERDPDVKLIQLPLINGQRELTWNSGDSRLLETHGMKSEEEQRTAGARSHLCGSRCLRCRRCRCCPVPLYYRASWPATPPCRPRITASATCTRDHGSHADTTCAGKWSGGSTSTQVLNFLLECFHFMNLYTKFQREILYFVLNTIFFWQL